MSETFITRFRREYLAGELHETDMLEDPHLQFLEWLEDARRSGINDPDAMALATVNMNGRPSVRIVLLKEARKDGLVFLTNYNSPKGKDLLINPYAAVVFYWIELDRQVRIEGSVAKIDEADSDALFHARPLESRVASVISQQSEPLSGREELDGKFQEKLNNIGDKQVMRPRHWGGYILKPVSYEFWQGRENRLNDRILYSGNDKGWTRKRLAP